MDLVVDLVSNMLDDWGCGNMVGSWSSISISSSWTTAALTAATAGAATAIGSAKPSSFTSSENPSREREAYPRLVATRSPTSGVRGPEAHLYPHHPPCHQPRSSHWCFRWTPPCCCGCSRCRGSLKNQRFHI